MKTASLLSSSLVMKPKIPVDDAYVCKTLNCCPPFKKLMGTNIHHKTTTKVIKHSFEQVNV